jgi:ribosomal protein S6
MWLNLKSAVDTIVDMRKYDLAVVLTEEGETAPKLVNQLKGKIITKKILGLKPLAYRIKQAVKGWYAFYQAELEASTVKELAKLLETDTHVLRFLLIKSQA